MLEYNEETRVHYIDGIKVPSVSQLLPRDEVWVDDETYEAARLDGIDKHLRIERYLDTGDTNFDLMLEKHRMPPVKAEDRAEILDYLAEQFPPRRKGRGSDNPFLK